MLTLIKKRELPVYNVHIKQYRKKSKKGCNICRIYNISARSSQN